MRESAAWRKRAVVGRPLERWWGTRLATPGALDGGGEQAAGVGVNRAADDLAERPLLDDLARVHHRNAVADFDGNADVVVTISPTYRIRAATRAREAGSGSAPSHPGPSSARPRAGLLACRRAPARSWRADACRNSRISARNVTLVTEPDSPISPNTSPSPSDSERSFAAKTCARPSSGY